MRGLRAKPCVRAVLDVVLLAFLRVSALLWGFGLRDSPGVVGIFCFALLWVWDLDLWLGLEFRADCRGVGLGCGLALLWLGRRLEGFRLGAFNTTVGVGARTGAQPSESVLESFHH